METYSEHQLLDELEERINQSVELISRLRTENTDVKRQNELLEEQLSSTRQAFEVLQSKFKKVEAQTASLERFKQREDQIRKKVSLMLSKLNALDS